MEELHRDERLDFLSEGDRAFLAAFTAAMDEAGYGVDGGVRDGFCWGRYMVVYTKKGVKSKKSYARVYLRDEGAALRLYLSGVDGHAAYIEAAPAFIQRGFTAEYGVCGHCHNQKADGSCSHRKSYTLGGALYEKCDGFTFEFGDTDAENIPVYMELLAQFYPSRRGKRS